MGRLGTNRYEKAPLFEQRSDGRTDRLCVGKMIHWEREKAHSAALIRHQVLIC